MDILSSPEKTRQWVRIKKQQGEKIVAIPTMGALHAGHLHLVDIAKQHGSCLVMSLFVNPTQFAAGEDLAKYPRDFVGDCQKAQSAGVHLMFAPEKKDMYASAPQTWVEVEGVTQHLCGAARPGHFRGMATVVTKLFHILEPDVAVFGEKDFQQLATIRRMVKDLNFAVEIVGVPTVREADGLAMSSRNAYLNLNERRAARCLFQALEAATAASRKANATLKDILAAAKSRIDGEPLARIDYLEGVDHESLQPLDSYRLGKTLLALAVFIGKTRLIDNRVV